MKLVTVNLCMFLDFTLFQLYCFQTETATGDAEIQNEYSRQREHLERSVASLRKKLAKDSEIHRADNVRIMQVSPSPYIKQFYLQLVAD